MNKKHIAALTVALATGYGLGEIDTNANAIEHKQVITTSPGDLGVEQCIKPLCQVVQATHPGVECTPDTIKNHTRGVWVRWLILGEEGGPGWQMGAQFKLPGQFRAD